MHSLYEEKVMNYDINALPRTVVKVILGFSDSILSLV